MAQANGTSHEDQNGNERIGPIEGLVLSRRMAHQATHDVKAIIEQAAASSLTLQMQNVVSFQQSVGTVLAAAMSKCLAQISEKHPHQTLEYIKTLYESHKMETTMEALAKVAGLDVTLGPTGEPFGGDAPTGGGPGGDGGPGGGEDGGDGDGEPPQKARKAAPKGGAQVQRGPNRQGAVGEPGGRPFFDPFADDTLP